jgi:hypothetical protein
MAEVVTTTETGTSNGPNNHSDNNSPSRSTNVHPQYQPDNNATSGDRLTPDKPTNTIRIYFQNINGVNKNNWNDWQYAATQMKRLQIDIVGCAETNILWTESKRKYAQYQISKHLKQANLAVSSSNAAGHTDYQPGGVATCINSKWTGRILEQINDSSGLGRWAGHILNGKENNNIVVITISTKQSGRVPNHLPTAVATTTAEVHQPQPRTRPQKTTTRRSPISNTPVDQQQPRGNPPMGR